MTKNGKKKFKKIHENKLFEFFHQIGSDIFQHF